ncbi:hypothetical protein MMC15_003472, partial [Xylographa vitiligo]|nr:hypothetical protein [Xylographa vitiligo]
MSPDDSSEKQNFKPRDVFSSVDPHLIHATEKNERTESINNGSFHAVIEDVLPVAVGQSSTLEIHRKEATIFGHIRRDSHEDSTGFVATTRMEEDDDDDQRGPTHDAPVIPKSTLPLFKDMAQGEVEDHTQDSTSIRVDDRLGRAGLQRDTSSSPAGRCGNQDAEDAEKSVNSGKHTITRGFDRTTCYNEQSNETNTITSPPPRQSNQANNVKSHDNQQREEKLQSSLELGVETSNLMDDESTLMDVGHETHTGGQESSESTIVVQPRPMKNSAIDTEILNRSSSASNSGNPKASTSSSFAGIVRSSYGSSSGTDGAVNIGTINVQFGSSTTVDTIPSIMKILRSLG